MVRLEMENCNAIVTEAAKISAFSSGKIDKYEQSVYLFSFWKNFGKTNKDD